MFAQRAKPSYRSLIEPLFKPLQGLPTLLLLTRGRTFARADGASVEAARLYLSLRIKCFVGFEGVVKG